GLVWDAERGQYPPSAGAAGGQTTCLPPVPAGDGGAPDPAVRDSTCTPPAFGGGIDASTLNAALRALAAQGADLANVTLNVTRDQAGRQPLAGAATGTVFVHVHVESALGPGAVSGV